jgi:hypothetical protein
MGPMVGGGTHPCKAFGDATVLGSRIDIHHQRTVIATTSVRLRMDLKTIPPTNHTPSAPSASQFGRLRRSTWKSMYRTFLVLQGYYTVVTMQCSLLKI